MPTTVPGPRDSDLPEEVAPLSVLLAHLPAAVAYLHGPDLVFAFANDAYRELVGGRDVVGLPVREALPEVDGQGYFEILDRVLATGEMHVGREAEVALDRQEQGEPVFVDFVYAPVPGPSGGVDGILVHAGEVTEHVRGRRALEQLAAELTSAEARYRTLFETLPYGVVYHDAQRRVIAMNPAARDILGADMDAVVGRPPDDIRWEAVDESGAPVSDDDVPAAVALRTGRIVADVVLGVPHRGTGERRWLRVTAVPDALDDNGAPQRAYAMFSDITDELRTAGELAEQGQLVSRLRDANVLGILLATEDRVYDTNDAVLDMIGYSRDDLQAGRVSWRDLTPPEWWAADDCALAELRETGACRPFEKEYVHRDGHRIPIMIGAAVIGQAPLRWVSYLVDLSEHRRAAVERARLAERERHATAAAAVAGEQLSTLLRAGSLLAATRDRDELLRHATRLVLPALGDWSAVLTPAPDGGLRLTTSAHRRPERAERLAALHGTVIPARSPVAVQLAFRTGETRVVSDAAVEAALWPEDHPLRQLLGELEPGSLVAAPMVTASHRLGVLVVARDRDRVPFSDQDETMLTELARQLGLGLRNAELSAHEHSVAETLQRAVLPGDLPDVEGLGLAVRYLPATQGIDVGGDWYDAFRLGRTLLGVVVGDVVGHSVTSASVMGQLRNTLRAYAVQNPDPAAVIAETNRAVLALMPEALATVFYGVLDTATGHLTYANAGHPPPLAATASGVHYLDDASGLMVGAGSDLAVGCGRFVAQPGDSLLLYTDGLVEDRHRDVGEGMRQLADAVGGAQGLDPDALCDVLVERMLGGRQRADDVCLLAARLLAR